MEIEQLIASYRAAGQGQVFAFRDLLSSSERAALANQAAEVDLAEVARLNRTLVLKSAGGAEVNLAGLSPAPCERLPENGGDAAEWAKARTAGETALRAGRIAAFTLAGGQGTRPGYQGPKGTVPAPPPQPSHLFRAFPGKIN